MLLLSRYNRVRFVNPASALISIIVLFESDKNVRLVNPDTALISLIVLFESDKNVRFVACSKPLRSAIPLSEARKDSNACIFCWVMGSPSDSPRVDRTAARKLASCIETSGDVSMIGLGSGVTLISISMNTPGFFSLSLRSGAKFAIGFPLRVKFMRDVKFSRGVTSLMLLLPSDNDVRFVNPATALISLMLFSESDKFLRFVNPATALMSLMLLLSKI